MIYRINGEISRKPEVLVAQSGSPYKAVDYIGFFKELPTCATIEEGIKSFEELEERRRIKRERPFAYKG